MTPYTNYLIITESNMFATFSLRFLYVFISEAGIAAEINLQVHIAAQAKGDINYKKRKYIAKVHVALPGSVFLDDELRRRTASNKL